MSTILKGSTKKGENVLAMGRNCLSSSLTDLYNNYSYAKQKAYEYCVNKYLETPESNFFGVGNANTFGFTASWIGLYNGEHAMFVETRTNSYIVLLDK